MKKGFISLFALLGLDTTALEASSEKLAITEEQLAEATAKVEELQSVSSAAIAAAKTEHEAALAHAQAEHAAAVAAKDARIAELENEVKTLGAKPGDKPTKTKTDSNNDVKGAGDLGLPAYANTDLPIYKELAAMQARFK